MGLAVGTRLGPYEIVAPIGAGGMGEVYRARDTKLKRDVALKVLPEAFASDPERMARFQREAEVLASLNHPNIAQIYGVEERALVMELVEGESPKGPMSFDEAWKIASQIAAGVEYAHEKGIVHRDLKPANVKVTADGVVKLLDFGLAKAYSAPTAMSGSLDNSPTLTIGATQLGVILGTAGYMAPEQAKGKPVDKRADIWAFGVVLYELLTGERMFQGEDVAETLAAVIHKQPDLERVPGQMRKLLQSCVEKDPKRRLRDIGDAWRQLEEPAIERPAASRVALLAPVIAAVMTASSVVLAFIAFQPRREESRLAKLFFPPPDKSSFANFPGSVVSPDGRRVVFETTVAGKTELWLRDLDNNSARMLVEVPATSLPFWAPDSRRLAFFDGSKLKKIDVTGGPAVSIADTFRDVVASGTWNQDDIILFTSPNAPGISRVPASGGTPALVTELDKTRGEASLVFPWFLPDRRHFLFLAVSTDPGKSSVWVGDLASKTRKQVLPVASSAIYVKPGYLLYIRDRTLMAQAFDTSKLETTGDGVPVAEQVDSTPMFEAVLGHFSASQNGVLIYTSGGAGGLVQLAWFDRTGKKLDVVGAAGYLQWFSLSPDGASIAMTRADSETGGADIWTRDLVHGGESRLTSAGNSRYPVWSADGSQIFFLGNRGGAEGVYKKPANGAGAEEVVEAALKIPMDASRDGHYLFTITARNNPKTSNDIWVFPLFGDGKPFAWAQSEFREAIPQLSPDGRWLAYQSDVSKHFDIYVESFPQKGEKWQISTNGGTDPVWSHDGRELYYYSADGKIMAAQIRPGATFQFDVPKPLFEARISANNNSFSVSKDGRFLLPTPVQEASAPMTVVLNWPELLKKK